jgi:hypothetical protein
VKDLRQVACAVLLLLSGFTGTVYAQAGDPFWAAGVTGPEVGEALKHLQTAVANRNPNAVAAMVKYPLSVRGKRGPRNIAEFVKAYPVIFNESVRAAVLNQTVENLVSTSRGVMIGTGEVWLMGLCDAKKSTPNTCHDHRIVIFSVNN